MFYCCYIKVKCNEMNRLYIYVEKTNICVTFYNIQLSHRFSLYKTEQCYDNFFDTYEEIRNQ